MTQLIIHRRFLLLALSALSLAVIICMPFIGFIAVAPDDIFSNTAKSSVFWDIRLARVFNSFVAGSALAVSGMAFQAIFRNPLATPFTLGVAHGAALGGSIYIWLGLGFTVLGFSGGTFFAFMGASAAILIVYGLSRLKQGLSTPTMLLAGVAVSFFFSSLILFIQYLSDFTQSFQIMRWLMGGLESVGYGSLLDMLPFALSGSAVIFYHINELNLMVTGEDIAISRGVNVKRIKAFLFFAVSLMTGCVVSVCGPIGFVGMMAPHICRLIIGHDHRYLTPAAILFGGIFLTMCDTLSRTLIAPAEMPVGVITALIGGPFFIWLLLGKNRIG